MQCGGNSRSSDERNSVPEIVRADFHGHFVNSRFPEWKKVTSESLFALSMRRILVGTYEFIQME
jgi:hypothetical protein